MAEIIPAILEKNFNEIKNKLTFLRGRVKCVQIDFCDGLYVPNQTWPFSSGGFNDYDFQKILNEEEGMPLWQDFDFEFDLMVEHAIENFDIYFKLGPKRMIFHYGAKKNIREFEHFLEGLDMYIRDNVEIGIAFKPNDDLAAISRFADKVDFL
jgi:pentose-5-phosphate-3-epimerase